MSDDPKAAPSKPRSVKIGRQPTSVDFALLEDLAEQGEPTPPKKERRTDDEAIPATPTEVEPENTPPARKPPLPASLQRGSAARGRPKKNVVRPWEEVAQGPGIRMTLILEPRDKARLDFLQKTYDRPIQRFLRGYIEDQLREESETAFAAMYPDAGPPDGLD